MGEYLRNRISRLGSDGAARVIRLRGCGTALRDRIRNGLSVVVAHQQQHVSDWFSGRHRPNEFILVGRGHVARKAKQMRTTPGGFNAMKGPLMGQLIALPFGLLSVLSPLPSSQSGVPPPLGQIRPNSIRLTHCVLVRPQRHCMTCRKLVAYFFLSIFNAMLYELV